MIPLDRVGRFQRAKTPRWSAAMRKDRSFADGVADTQVDPPMPSRVVAENARQTSKTIALLRVIDEVEIFLDGVYAGRAAESEGIATDQDFEWAFRVELLRVRIRSRDRDQGPGPGPNVVKVLSPERTVCEVAFVDETSK